MEDKMRDIASKLNGLLSNVSLEDVTSESSGFENLPDGYYLCEVESAELTVSKSSGQPMVAVKMKVIEDGHMINEDDEWERIKSSKNRKVFKYFVLKDERGVKSFVTDMLKFEGEVLGEPILEKEYFLNNETLEDALDIIVGLNIYIHVSTTENSKGESSTWQNLISWKRVDLLGLPQ